MPVLMSGKPQQMVRSGNQSNSRKGYLNLIVHIGYYEQQDEHQVDSNLRGKFYTGPQGEYSFYCIRPTPYPVPSDGPAGKLLQLLDRHPYRPAHIHLIVRLLHAQPSTKTKSDGIGSR